VADAAIGESPVAAGQSPSRWFDGLASAAAEKVMPALARIEAGNRSSDRGAGSAVYELDAYFRVGESRLPAVRPSAGLS
jgi:hypothetical protein